jgi:predicted oxidoreductase
VSTRKPTVQRRQRRLEHDLATEVLVRSARMEERLAAMDATLAAHTEQDAQHFGAIDTKLDALREDVRALATDRVIAKAAGQAAGKAGGRSHGAVAGAFAGGALFALGKLLGVL